MILDPEACISDAGFFRVGRTDERTNEQADSRSWKMIFNMINICAILILLRPEMKSTFHHTLIALAIVDILFLLTLIIDSQVARGQIPSLEPNSKSKISS